MNMAFLKIKMIKEGLKKLQQQSGILTREQILEYATINKLLNEVEESINKTMNQIRMGEYQY